MMKVLCICTEAEERGTGRVQTIMAFESVGVTMMAIMGIYPSLWPRCFYLWLQHPVLADAFNHTH